MPPHAYIAADKSINHRITMTVAVVEGVRKALPLSLAPEGRGGNAIELAKKGLMLWNNTSDFAKILTSYCRYKERYLMVST